MVVRHAPGLHVFLWRALVYFGLFPCVEAVKAAALDTWDRLVGQVDKASASRPEDPGFESHLQRDFTGSSHTSDFKIGTPVAVPCQAPGGIGSALGLVGPVSVYCDWVRYKSLIRNFYLSVAARKVV